MQVQDFEEAEELSGKLNYGSELMHSVLENDQDIIDKGKLIEEALDQGIGVFNPDVMFEKLVADYSMAKNLFGEKLIQAIAGFDANYIGKNINIPEFQKEIKKKIEQKMEQMKDSELIDKDNAITQKGLELASIVLYLEEIEKLTGFGMTGEKLHKKRDIHGIRQDIKNYKKGDRYKDLAVQKSVKTAVRRLHENLDVGDLKVFERQAKGKVELVYCLDSSSSMKGDKIKNAKKAGIALALKAIEEKDKVGLMIFGDEVKATLAPTYDFSEILKEITNIRARGQTNIGETIKRSVELFSDEQMIKHLTLLTDALPTVGEEPEKETLEAVSIARSSNITISIIGLNLNEEGKEIARKIVELGDGRLYMIKNLEELDRIVLEDYYSSNA